MVTIKEGCIVGIRWFAQMNEWMDCLVLVNASKTDDALEAIRAGVDAFWASDSECYGDCIERSLYDKHISYVIEYEDSNIYLDDEMWESHLDKYAAIGIPIINA